MTDEILWQSAKEGSLAAAGTLVNKLLPAISSAAKITSSQYPGLQIETEDLLQEGLIGAWKAIDTFCPDKNTKFQTYALTVADNAMRDYVRAIRSDIPSSGPLLRLDAPVPGIEDAFITYADIWIKDFSLSPEDIYIKKETISEVRNALQMISPRKRAYLHYRYGFIDDIEHDRKETAMHFHISISRAKLLEQSALSDCRENPSLQRLPGEGLSQHLKMAKCCFNRFHLFRGAPRLTAVL